ncbi:MAG: hypothetical protein AAF085_14190 [Planctomycetota bacterium]
MHKPLWGFGPIGWIASVVLVARIVAHVQGVDIWYQILKGVTCLVGGDGLMWFVSRLTLWTLINFTNGSGVVEASIILCAMVIASRRFAWWQMLYVALLGGALPVSFV